MFIVVTDGEDVSVNVVLVDVVGGVVVVVEEAVAVGFVASEAEVFLFFCLFI